MIWMIRVFLFYISPVIPSSFSIRRNSIPENCISWINSIPIRIHKIRHLTIQPPLLSIEFTYTLKNTSVVCYNAICTCISACIGYPYYRMTYITSFSIAIPIRLTIWITLGSSATSQLIASRHILIRLKSLYHCFRHFPILLHHSTPP